MSLRCIGCRKFVKKTMSSRTNYSSGGKWEDIVGYSRAVKVGNIIEVSGTVASDDTGNVVGENDAYMQTQFAISKIQRALEQAGASLSDVVRTRLFITDVGRWDEYIKAHREAFADIKPCCSVIEIKALVGPDYLVEVEATAIMDKS